MKIRIEETYITEMDIEEGDVDEVVEGKYQVVDVTDSTLIDSRVVAVGDSYIPDCRLKITDYFKENVIEFFRRSDLHDHLKDCDIYEIMFNCAKTDKESQIISHIGWHDLENLESVTFHYKNTPDIIIELGDV